MGDKRAEKGASRGNSERLSDYRYRDERRNFNPSTTIATGKRSRTKRGPPKAKAPPAVGRTRPLVGPSMIGGVFGFGGRETGGGRRRHTCRRGHFLPTGAPGTRPGGPIETLDPRPGRTRNGLPLELNGLLQHLIGRRHDTRGGLIAALRLDQTSEGIGQLYVAGLQRAGLHGGLQIPARAPEL